MQKRRPGIREAIKNQRSKPRFRGGGGEWPKLPQKGANEATKQPWQMPHRARHSHQTLITNRLTPAYSGTTSQRQTKETPHAKRPLKSTLFCNKTHARENTRSAIFAMSAEGRDAIRNTPLPPRLENRDSRLIFCGIFLMMWAGVVMTSAHSIFVAKPQPRPTSVASGRIISSMETPPCWNESANFSTYSLRLLR